MCEKTQQLRRCLVVIPALDPDETLPGYVSALLERGAEQVVVVDDGSRPSCRPVFQDLETQGDVPSCATSGTAGKVGP